MLEGMSSLDRAAFPRPQVKRRRVLVCACGSRGDVQQFIALVLGLKKAGYFVHIVTTDDHIEMVKEFGLSADGIGMDMHAIFETPAFSKPAREGDTAKVHSAMIGPNKSEGLVKTTKLILQTAVNFKPDIILASEPLFIISHAVAVELGVPAIQCLLTSRTDDYLCLHIHSRMMLQEAFQPTIMEVIPSYKPWSIDNFWQFAAATRLCPEPTLVAVSTRIVPKNPAFKRHKYTGYWTINNEQQNRAMSSGDHNFGGQDAETITRFLAQRGEGDNAPVYFGWGSMTAVSAEHMACLAVRSLKLTQLRGIVLGGWAGVTMDHVRKAQCEDATELAAYAEENVIFVETAPHEWLFPQCSVIVHHGGSGTMAAALRSGRPSIVTPCLFDQTDNAQLVKATGAGIALESLQVVSAKSIATAIKQTVEVGELVQCAASLGEHLRAENGVDNAVLEINRFIQEDLKTGLWAKRNRELSDAILSHATSSFGWWISAAHLLCGCIDDRQEDWDEDERKSEAPTW